ncbi:MAG: ABC transporter ATP-binding protein [Trebonia sp.]
MNSTPLLEARNLCAGYAGVEIVRDVSIEVWPGEVVALLGANGAGKTTTMLTLAGELKPLGGEVRLKGVPTTAPTYQRTRNGMGFVTEERSVFFNLTTRQNLAVGRADIAKATALFPELEPLMSRRGGLLSGSEQQMLTLGRALSRDTDLLLADELSLGLAPKTVGRLLRSVRAAADGGVGALLVEQHVHRVLEIADRVYLLHQGRIEFTGTADEARTSLDEIQATYLAARRSAGEAVATTATTASPARSTDDHA